MKTGNKKTKTSVSITTYKKEFDNFNDALKSLINVSPVIAEIFTEDMTIKQASQRALELITDNFPSIEDGENIHYSINLSSNKCVIKTKDKISFGWLITYHLDKKEKVAVIDKVTATITTFGDAVVAFDSEEEPWEITQ